MSALCLVAAGCAPAFYGGGPGLNTDGHDRSTISVAGPICEVSSADPNFATVECRDVEVMQEPQARPAPALVRAQPTVALAPRPIFIEADDELAPDPFAELPEAAICSCEPTAEDNLAPDPFAEPRHDNKLRQSPPLAEDDLAPNPFADGRREPRLRKSKPLAEDDLAPDPFATPVR